MAYSITDIENYAVRGVSFVDDTVQTATVYEDLFTQMGRNNQLHSISFLHKNKEEYESTVFHHIHRQIRMNPLKRYIPLHAPINILSNTLNPTTVAGSIVDDGDDTVYVISDIGTTVPLRIKKDTIELTSKEFSDLGGTSGGVFVGHNDIGFRVV